MVDLNKRIKNEVNFHDHRYAHDDRARRYNKLYEFNYAINKLYKDFCIHHSNGKSVLEIGCGSGTDLGKSISSIAKYFHAIDISKTGIKKAQKFYGKHENVKVCDIHNTNYNTNYFDLIVCTATLHHLDIKIASKEIMRILKPNGHFVMIEPLGTNPLINIYRHFTPNDRSADERPLTLGDLRFLSSLGSSCSIKFHNVILSFLAFLHLKRNNYLSKIFFSIDSFLCRVPILRLLSWYSFIIIRK